MAGGAAHDFSYGVEMGYWWARRGWLGDWEVWIVGLGVGDNSSGSGGGGVRYRA